MSALDTVVKDILMELPIVAKHHDLKSGVGWFSETITTESLMDAVFLIKTLEERPEFDKKMKKVDINAGRKIDTSKDGGYLLIGSSSKKRWIEFYQTTVSDKTEWYVWRVANDSFQVYMIDETG